MGRNHLAGDSHDSLPPLIRRITAMTDHPPLSAAVRDPRLRAFILLSASAALVNLVVARLLLREGRRHRSIVLEADGQHLMTDVWTSVAVLIGIVLVMLTKQVWLDPVAALVMAANIIWTGSVLLRRAF